VFIYNDDDDDDDDDEDDDDDDVFKAFMGQWGGN